MGQQRQSKTYEPQIIALSQILQILREEKNTDVVIKTAIDYLSKEFHYRLIWIGIYDRMEHLLLGKGGITPEGDSHFLKQRFFLNSGDLLEQIVIQQRPIGISDLRQEIRAGEWHQLAQKLNIQGTLLFPLCTKNLCFGVALLGSHGQEFSPSAGDKAQLSILFGSLATALYQIELEWQRSSTKHPEQPLFEIIEQVQSKPTLALRLESIVAQTQKFVQPTRTNLYWYSPEKRYFWHRVGNQQIARSLGNFRGNAAGIKVTDAPDFYQSLTENQLVAIGAGRSPLSSQTTEQLLSRLRTRSLLAAPIFLEEQLVGFLAVEDQEARIWEATETKYVRAVAQMVSLALGSEEIENLLEQARADSEFVTEIAQVLTEHENWKKTLKNSARALCKHLEVNSLLVLKGEQGEQARKNEIPDSTYSLVYQYTTINRHSLTSPLSVIAENDWRYRGKSSPVIVIEDIEEDKQLASWRKQLSQIEVRSLIAYRFQDEDSTIIVLVSHDQPHTWNRTAIKLSGLVTQNIGWLMKLGPVKNQLKAVSFKYQTLKTSLMRFWSTTSDFSKFESTWLDYLGKLLEVPYAMLLSWHSSESESNEANQTQAKIVATLATNPNLSQSENVTIPLNDPLIKAILATNKFYCTSISEISSASRSWFFGEQPDISEQAIKNTNSSNLDQIIAIALHTSTAVEPTGIVLFAKEKGHSWSEERLELVGILVRQLAWLNLWQNQVPQNQSTIVATDKEDYQALNWYKHLCLEVLHQSVSASIGALLALESQLHKQLGESQSLRLMRQQQLMRQLEDTLTVLLPVLNREKLQITPNFTSVPLANLLKRSLRLVDSLHKQRKLLMRVHNTGSFNIHCDPLKLECVLFELLVTYCNRVPSRGKIEIQSRLFNHKKEVFSNDEQSLQIELSIIASQVSSLDFTDNNLLTELSEQDSVSPVEPENLNLKICQRVLRSLEGELQFYNLEGGHYWSRLILPMG